MHRLLHIGIRGHPSRALRRAGELGLLEASDGAGRPPKPAELRRWRARAPGGLRFTVLAHRPAGVSATYLQHEPEVLASWKATRDVAEALGAEVIVLETPAAFRASRANAAALRNFAYAGSARQRIAWHPAAPWPGAMLADLCDELALLHACDPLHAESQSKTPYFRLPRRGRGYSARELDRVLAACARAEEAWVVFPSSMMGSARRFRELAWARFDAPPPPPGGLAGLQAAAPR